MKSTIFVLLMSLCLISCSKPTELSGEAFIVTEGAGNYKLGLVTVFVISESNFKTNAAGAAMQRQSLLADYKSQSEKCAKLPSSIYSYSDDYSTTRSKQLDENICENEKQLVLKKLTDLYMPPMVTSVAAGTTNADGKFTLKIPKTGKYIVAGSATRKVGEKSEVYSWFVPFEATGESQSIMLSNNNTYDPDNSLY